MRKSSGIQAFTDVAGPLNNVHSQAIFRALNKPVTKLVTVILAKRINKASITAVHMAREVNRGSPKGGVPSLLLWNIVVVVVIFLRCNNSKLCFLIGVITDPLWISTFLIKAG